MGTVLKRDIGCFYFEWLDR